ncbi:MAG TPA: hypothetical protein VJ725_07220 [Thermoanaerobaculia bacterium]|nr:hypothetical protein [Thermoanaerobaculia bacterium]
MPKAEKKASPKKAATKKTARGGKAKTLSENEMEAILKSFHRVLRNKEVEHPIRLELATADGDHCRRWECRTINGKRVCGWFPC